LLIAREANAQQQAPELLTYDELVRLYEEETPPEALRDKLRRLLTTPFVSNAASAGGVRPLLPSTAKLGQLLRVVEWNIERGLEYDAVRLAFTDAAGFAKLIDSKAYPRGSISDHSPMMVDLPLGEPRIVRGERRRAAAR
jgi:hypothetical protein